MSRFEKLERAERLERYSREKRDQHDALVRKIRGNDEAMLAKATQLWNDSLKCAEKAAQYRAEAMTMETA